MNKAQFYEELPEQFTRKEAVDIAERFEIKERTMDNFLKKNDLFEKSQYGKYRKRHE